MNNINEKLDNILLEMREGRIFAWEGVKLEGLADRIDAAVKQLIQTKIVVSDKDLQNCHGKIFTLKDICAACAKTYGWENDYTISNDGIVEFKKEGVKYQGYIDGLAFVCREMNELDGKVFGYEECVDWGEAIGGGSVMTATLNGETVYIVIP